MSAVTSSNAGPLKSKLGAHAERKKVLFLHPLFVLFVHLLIAGCSFAQSASRLSSDSAKPPDVPREWKQWLRDYRADGVVYTVGEENGSLIIISNRGGKWWISNPPVNTYDYAGPVDLQHPLGAIKFSKDKAGTPTLFEGAVPFAAIAYGAESGGTVRIKPVRPVTELRKEALTADPPAERGQFRAPDLIELISLDPSIHLDIRYATSNDFLGVPVYTQARAFLQRPAAEALLRVLQKLKPLGYGLLIHDGYRPWYVTKIFWDATPPEGKIFVADPAKGSRHNRGCAVDLTLYDLKTGAPIEMTGLYDEMSPRSFPDYPGGSSLQRWHRDLLRRAMESEGFTVYESEWWHFDYKDWPEYGILNIPFEKLGIGSDQK